ncbi:hypothetical protein RJ639_040807 [Escallonia herrerae]|uniref:Uncharacterized protein n=1 Tax=Escallonia herrerae TaxID=1293975 RepID=A0AA88WL78_9ASTE|nr:hypothetical protein RJ639_040807 [Escallonia herrerae]
MASALITLRSLDLASSPKLAVASNPFVFSNLPTSWSPKRPHHFKLNHLQRAASEGLPTDLIEDSKFVPLNAEDTKFGPPALLFLGFEVEEVAKIQQLLKELDGEFLELLIAADYSLNHRGEEMMMFMDAFPETGLEPAVFAALVPNSADKPLRELVEEIIGDHEMLHRQQGPSKSDVRLLDHQKEHFSSSVWGLGAFYSL